MLEVHGDIYCCLLFSGLFELWGFFVSYAAQVGIYLFVYNIVYLLCSNFLVTGP